MKSWDASDVIALIFFTLLGATMLMCGVSLLLTVLHNIGIL